MAKPKNFTKISDRQTLIKVLRINGFSLSGDGKKHEKWVHRDGRNVSVPRKHSCGKFSRFCSQNILRTAKII